MNYLKKKNYEKVKKWLNFFFTSFSIFDKIFFLSKMDN